MENKTKNKEIDEILRRIQERAVTIQYLRRKQTEDRARVERLERDGGE